MNSKKIGDISEAKILTRLLELEKEVLIPWGDNCRYDLAIVENNILYRIQVKTGRYIKGVIKFKAYSCTTKNGERIKTNYDNQIEYIAVYCPDLDKSYMIPISKINSNSNNQIRVDEQIVSGGPPPKWAKDFEI